MPVINGSAQHTFSHEVGQSDLRDCLPPRHGANELKQFENSHFIFF